MGVELKAALLRQTRVAPQPGPRAVSSGLGPSPGVAGGACAKGRERTSLQGWGLRRARKDLGGCFRSARTVAYLLEGRSAACARSRAGCASGRQLGRTGSAAPRIPRINGGRLRRAEPGFGQAAGAGQPSPGLSGEGQLGGLSQSGGWRDSTVGKRGGESPKPRFWILD